MRYSDFSYSNNRIEIDKLLNKDNINKQENNNAVIVENGYILPHRDDKKMTYGVGGVIDKNHNFITESAFSLIMGDGKIDWGGYYNIDSKQKVIIDEEVIFGGFVNNNEWGHFLVDWSTRLWYALKENLDSKIFFCVRTETECFLPNILRLMKLGGIDTERVIIVNPNTLPILCKRIIIPQEALCPKYYTDNYFLLFRNAVEKVKKEKMNLQPYEKIYMTRTQLKPKKEIGEKYIEKVFRQKGYFIIAPETLTVDEQIYYICNCKELASIEGSAAHNIVFAEKGHTHQIILEKKRGYNIRQLIINEISNIKVDYIGAYTRNIFISNIDDLFKVEVSKDLMNYFEIDMKISVKFFNRFVNTVEFWVTYAVRTSGILKNKIYRKFRG